MITDNIVQFRLLKEEFKEYPVSGDYRIIHVTKYNYRKYIKELLNVSELLKADIEWDGIPDLTGIQKRFVANSECFLWYYKSELVGWTWFNESVSIDWESIFKLLPSNEVYVGGAFVSKKKNLPPAAGFNFYNLCFNSWLRDFNYNKIYLYSDDWNRASAILCYRCGFKKYSFL